MEISDSEHIKLAHKRLFATLLTDPEKKAKVLELLTQEGLVVANENMSPNLLLNRSKFNSPRKKLHEIMSSPKHHKKIESPSALGRRRALQQLESDSSLDEPQEKTPTTLIRRPSNVHEVQLNEILKDFIVYCEVRSNGEDRSSSIKTMVRALGATVRDKITRDVTHVIFKDGLYSTFRKAKNLKMHIVSVLWLDAVRRYKCQMPEEKYKPLDFDKYNNMNESQVCQKIEEEFNDVLTDEVRRSAVKKPKFQSHFDNQNICSRSFSSNDLQGQDDDSTRSSVVTPSSQSSRSASPVSKNDLSVSCKSIQSPKNNNKEPLVVPCSQNDSHSFTHTRKSNNLSRVVEETFENQSASLSSLNIAKHTRDSFELKKVQNLKLPPHEIAKKSSELKQNSVDQISINDEESINLHLTTTTDNSLNSTRKRSSTNFAQNLLTSDLAAGNDLNHVSIGTRSLANSIDLLNGPINDNINSKNRKRTTAGLSRSRKSSGASLENVQKQTDNIVLNEKANSLLNNVDGLLNDEENDKPVNGITIRGKRGRARKLFNGDHVDESLFNWDKADELPPIETCKTSSKKRKVELPPGFPKNVSSKARQKTSTMKKPIVNNNIPAKETLAKILDFGEKNADGKTTTISSDPNSKNYGISICGIKVIEDSSNKHMESSKQNIDEIKTKRKSIELKNDSTTSDSKDNSEIKNKTKRRTRKSIAAMNYEIMSTTDECDNSGIKNKTKRPKRKSIATINYKIMSTSTDDNDDNQPLTNNLTNDSPESYKTATSDLPSIEKPKKRKSSRMTISTISSNNSENETFSPKISKTVKNNKRKSRLTACSISSDNSDSSNQITEMPKNTPITRKLIVKQTPVTKMKNTPVRSTKQPSVTDETPTKSQNVEKTPNRRSTMEFLPRSSRKSLARTKASEEPKQIPVKISGIVCTRFRRSDTQVFSQIVTKLGGFFVQNEVNKRTTHLVCEEPIRTINLLRAIARGCWILRKEWLYKSLEAGRWVEEEDYEMVEFSSTIQKCRLEKQSFGSLYSMDLFKNCGTIYISRGSNPRCSDLEELVQLCGGSIVRIICNANIIVGEKNRNDKNNVVSVTEKWILDSITDNKKKKFKNYEILNTET